MLVAPIRDPDTGSLLGVVQLINTLNREPFSKMAEEGLMGLAQTLGVAFLRHNRQSGRLRSRFGGAGGRRPHHRRGARSTPPARHARAGPAPRTC